MKCYNCDTELTETNESREHLLPNFLGGRLTSSQLLCSKCNNEFGSTIDKELSDQLGFAADLIISKRHRKKSDRGITMETLKGQKIVVGQKLLPKPKLTIKIPNKDEAVEMTGEDESLRSIALEKKKQLESKFGEFTLTESLEYPAAEKYHFKNKVSEKIGEIVFGGSDYFRAIGKIALNFYLAKKNLSNARQS